MSKIDLTKMGSAELLDALKSLPVEEWNEAHIRARRESGYLWRASLYGASLDGANLDGATLDGANLSRANLYGANLNRANLNRANLNRANLTGATLDGANLTGANLTGANLTRANLDGANLDGANLDGANLSRANLNRANLNRANLNGKPITIEDWCNIFDLATTGKGLRVAFKRLPENRVTGEKYGNKIKWKSGKWVECPDWDDSPACGGGLHVSPSPQMTRYYSSESLCVPVAFDPKDAVMLGDKLKVKRLKVMG